MNKPIFITILILTILMPLFFLPFNTDAVNFPKSVLFIGLVLLALLFWLIGILKSKKIEIKRSILDYPIIALIVVYFCSSLLSIDKYVSFSQFVVILFMGIFYFLIVQIITPKRRKILLKVLVISGLAAGLVFIISNLGFINPSLIPPLLRGENKGGINPLGTQSILVALLAILVPIVYKWRWLMILPLLIILGVLTVVNFEIGWIVLGAGTLIYLVFDIVSPPHNPPLVKGGRQGGSKYKIIPMVVLVIAILMIVLNISPAKYLKLQLPAEVSLSRELSWDIAWKNTTVGTGHALFLRGLLGSGPETFWFAFSKYRPERFNQNALWSVRFQKANNFWLENLATIGWLGVLIWLVIFALSFWKNPKYITPIFVAGIFTNFSIVLLFLLFLYLALIPSLIRRGNPPKAGGEVQLFVKELPGSSIGLGFVLILAVMIIFGAFVGRVYLADYYFAKNNIEKSVQLNKYNPIYHLALAQQAISELAGMRNKEKAEILLARAVNSSKKAVDMSPDNAGFWQARGQIFNSLNQNEWAMKSYQKAQELEPTNPVLQYEIGRLYYNQGDIEKAGRSFEKAVLWRSNYSNALYSLALVYEKQNKNKEALELFKKVLELNPDNTEVKDKIQRFDLP